MIDRENPPEIEITGLLDAWSRGEPEALDRLAEAVQSDVHFLAHRALAREARKETFQTTDLLSEVYLRLMKRRSVQWSNRQQFFGFLTQLMGRVLVDRARRRLAAKRGGGVAPLELDEEHLPGRARPEEIIALYDALEELEKIDPQQAEILRLSFFVGLSQEDIAKALELTKRQVARDLRNAKVFLRRLLTG